jgi:hypothetical protein
MGRRRILGGVDWGGFIGRLLGFLGDGWMAGGPWRLRLGHAAGIPRPRLARRGAAVTAPRCLSHGASVSRRGSAKEGEKVRGKEGLTGGPHMAVTKRRGGW